MGLYAVSWLHSVAAASKYLFWNGELSVSELYGTVNKHMLSIRRGGRRGHEKRVHWLRGTRHIHSTWNVPASDADWLGPVDSVMSRIECRYCSEPCMHSESWFSDKPRPGGHFLFTTPTNTSLAIQLRFWVERIKIAMSTIEWMLNCLVYNQSIAIRHE